MPLECLLHPFLLPELRKECLSSISRVTLEYPLRSCTLEYPLRTCTLEYPFLRRELSDIPRAECQVRERLLVPWLRLPWVARVTRLGWHARGCVPVVTSAVSWMRNVAQAKRPQRAMAMFCAGLLRAVRARPTMSECDDRPRAHCTDG